MLAWATPGTNYSGAVVILPAPPQREAGVLCRVDKTWRIHHTTITGFGLVELKYRESLWTHYVREPALGSESESLECDTVQSAMNRPLFIVLMISRSRDRHRQSHTPPISSA